MSEQDFLLNEIKEIEKIGAEIIELGNAFHHVAMTGPANKLYDIATRLFFYESRIRHSINKSI